MATWEECNVPIEKIVPPPSPAPPGGDCPDLSEDTIAANKLLSGYTAHDAEGNEITGTLTGMDFVTSKCIVTNNVPNAGITVIGVATWSESGERLNMSQVGINAPGIGDNVAEIPLFRGNNMLWLSATNPRIFTDLSTGVVVANGGQPVTIGTASYYILRVQAAQQDRSFTVEAGS